MNNSFVRCTVKTKFLLDLKSFYFYLLFLFLSTVHEMSVSRDKYHHRTYSSPLPGMDMKVLNCANFFGNVTLASRF